MAGKKRTTKKSANQRPKRRKAVAGIRKAAAAAEPRRTPCEHGGDPNAPIGIIVEAGSELALQVWVCFSPARLRVTWDQQAVFDGNVVDFKEVAVGVAARDEHWLSWTVIPTANQYQTRGEIKVNGQVRFMDKSSSANGGPHPSWNVMVEVRDAV